MRRVLAWALVVAVVVGAVAGGLFWSDPLRVLRSVQRGALSWTLGAPERIEGPRGPMVVWDGGEGRTVVLLHGFGDEAAGWQQVAAGLEDHARVVVPDLPGHGRSAPAEPPLTIDDLYAGLDAVLAREFDVVLVGNSLGGWLALHYALEHPDRVAAVVGINSAGLPSEVDRSILMPATREAVAAKNAVVMGEHVPPMPGFLLDAFTKPDPRLPGLFDSLEGRHPELGGMAVPVHLLWGTPDAFFPVEGYLDRMRAELPAAELTLLEGCGHAPQYSCADATVQAIRKVLNP